MLISSAIPTEIIYRPLTSSASENRPVGNQNLTTEISKHLGPSDFQLEMDQTDYERCPGTGSWLLEDHSFVELVKSKTSASLFLCGGPGSGKTFLMTHVIDYLRKLYAATEDTAITYFLCDSKSDASSKRTSLAILKTVAAQLL